MPSFPNHQPYTGRTIMASSPRKTSSILIKSRSQTSMMKHDQRSSDSEISRSAELMYDSATWRMYYRISNARKRRARVMDSKASSRISSTRSRDKSESDLFKKYSLKQMSERSERNRSSSICSDVSQNVPEEPIFDLEL
jgi:hypothetical protein